MGDRVLAELLRQKGISDERVLEAIARLSRRAFIGSSMAEEAQLDVPLSIGHGQTISQPYIVALMTQALSLTGDERVLEIGTGSGYQAAVLAQLCRDVYSIEVVPELHAQAVDRLAALSNVHLRLGDGYLGWPEEAPFDRVVLTAAPPELPARLVAQLAVGGRMVAPVGGVSGQQELVRLTRESGERLTLERLLPVRFVPMVHPAYRS